jgi:hypothetical protein
LQVKPQAPAEQAACAFEGEAQALPHPPHALTVFSRFVSQPLAALASQLP